MARQSMRVVSRVAALSANLNFLLPTGLLTGPVRCAAAGQRGRGSLAGAAFAAALALAAALPCAAATLTVTSTADDGTAGTLRHALANAADDDTIDITATGTIALTGGELVVDKDLTITGPGQDQLTVSGKQASRVFYIKWGTAVTISGLTITNGMATKGGAIFNEGALKLTDCTLSGNTAPGHSEGETEHESAGAGGAIYVIPWRPEIPTTLEVDRCTLSGNLAGGGDAVKQGYGGAIFVGASDGALVTATVTNSTLVGNMAFGLNGGQGGAIAVGFVDDYETGADLIIRNSTLADNAADAENGVGVGGAISNFKGTVTLDNSTLADNYNYDTGDPSFPASGAIVTMLGSLKIRNTILANDPPAANLFSDSTVIEDLGYNLCTDDCGEWLGSSTTLLETDPLLGSLADNGGPTQTLALQAGSPAIDAAADTDSAGDPVAFDQRGVERPQGSANDIGAFESESSPASMDFCIYSDDSNEFCAIDVESGDWVYSDCSGSTILGAADKWSITKNGLRAEDRDVDQFLFRLSGNFKKSAGACSLKISHDQAFKFSGDLVQNPDTPCTCAQP
jgi:hypothetical protein